VSNFTVKHLEDLANAGMKVSVNQVEFHPYLYQENLLNYCNMNQITIEAHSPLAGGKVFSDPFLSKMGEKYGKTATQITLAYLLHLGFIAIPKASSKEHLEQNLSAQEIILEKEDIDSIIKMNENLRLICPSVQDFDYK
jgi:diketogulonate reductase-like aldo/keto reductase